MNTKFFSATPKLISYLIKFAFRLSAFGIMLWLYIHDKSAFYLQTTTSPTERFTFMHMMWLVFMGLMLLHIFPTKILSMGAGKSLKANFVPIKSYSEAELLDFVRNENKKSRRCMLAWLGGNSVIILLYLFGVIGKPELLLLTGFYFLCDYICILIFCPFQTFGQKDKCCVNCRIYDWGHFFMFTPMLFVGTFYSLSLFFMGSAVIIVWEIKWKKHPERFWYGSNKTLSCTHCKDKTCQIKQAVRNSVVKPNRKK